MASKDKNKSDSFNNPFSRLKGLSVSSQAKAPEKQQQKPLAVQPDPIPEPHSEPVDPAEQFARAMGQLGVQRTEPDDLLEKSAPIQPIEAVTPESIKASVGDHIQTGSRRQMRKAVRRMGEPEATLDLHGVAAAEVVRKTEWFLENAVFHGCRFVRIVTGKGTHSASGPVLRPLVESYLSGPGHRFVVVWTKAPANHGGEGALLVELQSLE